MTHTGSRHSSVCQTIRVSLICNHCTIHATLSETQSHTAPHPALHARPWMLTRFCFHKRSARGMRLLTHLGSHKGASTGRQLSAAGSRRPARAPPLPPCQHNRNVEVAARSIVDARALPTAGSNRGASQRENSTVTVACRCAPLVAFPPAPPMRPEPPRQQNRNVEVAPRSIFDARALPTTGSRRGASQRLNSTVTVACCCCAPPPAFPPARQLTSSA